MGKRVQIISLSLILLSIHFTLCASVVYMNVSSGLTEIPSDNFYSNITCIILNNNNIQSIPAFAFNATPFLDILEIKFNLLTSIDKDAFTGTCLRILRLISNQLIAIPDLSAVADTLSEIHVQLNSISDVTNLIGLKQLTRVYLNKNLLTSLPAAIFLHNPCLTSFMVRDNQIATLEDMSNISLNVTLLLDVQDNPIECDCRLAWFMNYADPSLDLLGICSAPAHLANVPLANLTHEQVGCLGKISSIIVSKLLPL